MARQMLDGGRDYLGLSARLLQLQAIAAAILMGGHMASWTGTNGNDLIDWSTHPLDGNGERRGW